MRPETTLRAQPFIAVSWAVLAGCASYPERTAGAMRDFQRGDHSAAIAGFEDPEDTGSSFLSGAEAGTVALVAGDWELARTHLLRAAAAAEDLERRALAGAEQLSEGLASWAVNDTARAYQGEGFERVYVHAGLAMAFLADGFLDDVYVEARLANQLLETEEELYEATYRAGGWGHLLSALAYELLGEYDDAYIDYRRMVEKDVGTSFAGPALIRLAEVLGRDEDKSTWVERFGPAPECPPDAASVVLLAGVGLAPFKVQGKLPVPTPDGLVTIAAPSYQGRPQPVSQLRLTVAETGARATSVVVEDVARIARENLEDRLLWTTTKSVGRGLLKRELTKKLEGEFGLGGRIAGDVFSFVSEQADLRSWLTLPASWQAARLYVPGGVSSLRLEALGGESVDLGSFELEPGETMLVYARTVGTRLFAHAIGGGLVESGSGFN